MAFKLATLRDLPQQITSDLPSFDHEDVASEKPIAKGGFGFVSKANSKNKTVVVKKITSESYDIITVLIRVSVSYNHQYYP